MSSPQVSQDAYDCKDKLFVQARTQASGECAIASMRKLILLHAGSQSLTTLQSLCVTTFSEKEIVDTRTVLLKRAQEYFIDSCALLDETERVKRCWGLMLTACMKPYLHKAFKRRSGIHIPPTFMSWESFKTNALEYLAEALLPIYNWVDCATFVLLADLMSREVIILREAISLDGTVSLIEAYHHYPEAESIGEPLFVVFCNVNHRPNGPLNHFEPLMPLRTGHVRNCFHYISREEYRTVPHQSNEVMFLTPSAFSAEEQEAEKEEMNEVSLH